MIGGKIWSIIVELCDLNSNIFWASRKHNSENCEQDNPISQGSARPHRYCLRNLWTREENGQLGQERLLIFMVTILKSMVSRRFTSAANLSAKIMQQRSYEVRKICTYWCCWACKASNRCTASLYAGHVCLNFNHACNGRSQLITHRVFNCMCFFFVGCSEETELTSN